MQFNVVRTKLQYFGKAKLILFRMSRINKFLNIILIWNHTTVKGEHRCSNVKSMLMQLIMQNFVNFIVDSITIAEKMSSFILIVE